MKTSIISATLFTSLLLFSGCGDSSTSSGYAQNGAGSSHQSGTTGATTQVDVYAYDLAPLDDKQKYSLAYMWNEERLAQDVYLNLYKVHSDVRQLSNIALNAERMHIELVQNLVEAYDINITNLVDYTQNYSEEELNAMPDGVYGIEAIQNLYDILYAKGVVSSQAALEVGCMVEVTDIDDLNKYIADAGDNQALLDTFDVLRDGSYSHYWSFDRGLINMGISDGCCSLGTDFCKPEYPNSN
jgi:hypothetical protein